MTIEGTRVAMRIHPGLRIFSTVLFCLSAAPGCSGARPSLTDITLPPGFSIAVYAGNVPGFVHSYIGQEAIATGVCLHLSREDRIVSRRTQDGSWATNHG